MKEEGNEIVRVLALDSRLSFSPKSPATLCSYVSGTWVIRKFPKFCLQVKIVNDITVEIVFEAPEMYTGLGFYLAVALTLAPPRFRFICVRARLANRTLVLTNCP